MIACWFAQERYINVTKRKQYTGDLRRLSKQIKETIDMVEKPIENIVASKLFDYHSCFVLGKGKAEAIAKEASLKIKEILYVHAEGYSSSALKHAWTICVA